MDRVLLEIPGCSTAETKAGNSYQAAHPQGTPAYSFQTKFAMKCPKISNYQFTYFKIHQNLNIARVFCRLYSTMAMLPMKQGMRRAILYGGKEKSKQVITVGHCY